ncbi:SCO family protein, partial [Bacillus paranthracis]
WDLETFQFTNQDGKPFGTKDLKGKVWVADFMFTNCQTVCPPMTANMA